MGSATLHYVDQAFEKQRMTGVRMKLATIPVGYHHRPEHDASENQAPAIHAWRGLQSNHNGRNTWRFLAR
jgi:hypothetical protein